MNLVGFCRLVTEAVDKVLCLLYHPLLVLIGSGLLGNSLSPEVDVLAVWYFIIVDMSKKYLSSAVSYVIEELPVVGNQKNRTPETFQIIFEPLDGLDIKVVGRLVKKKDFRLREKNLCKLKPHVPPLTECFCLSGELIILESKSPESFSG